MGRQEKLSEIMKKPTIKLAVLMSNYVQQCHIVLTLINSNI